MVCMSSPDAIHIKVLLHATHRSAVPSAGTPYPHVAVFSGRSTLDNNCVTDTSELACSDLEAIKTPAYLLQCA